MFSTVFHTVADFVQELGLELLRRIYILVVPPLAQVLQHLLLLGRADQLFPFSIQLADQLLDAVYLRIDVITQAGNVLLIEQHLAHLELALYLAAQFADVLALLVLQLGQATAFALQAPLQLSKLSL